MEKLETRKVCERERNIVSNVVLSHVSEMTVNLYMNSLFIYDNNYNIVDIRIPNVING